MTRGEGDPSVVVAMIDGPIGRHPDLSADVTSTPDHAMSVANDHALMVAGILFARRGTPAPAICPGCTPLVRPIFGPDDLLSSSPAASSKDLSAAIRDCVDRGADVINLSLALAQPTVRTDPGLDAALNVAARRGCMVVAAAGNQSVLASSPITRHPWVVPVAAFSLQGAPVGRTNLGAYVGRRGVGGPGEEVLSLAANAGYAIGGGTSTAVAFVSGVLGLVLSALPTVSRPQLRRLLAERRSGRSASVVPPLLDAEAVYTAARSLSATRVSAN
jgi:subtilisin family serine protease